MGYEMPRLKKQRSEKPWWGSSRELKANLYEWGKEGCTLSECSDTLGVSRGRLVKLLEKYPTFYRAYRRGLTVLDRRTRSQVAAFALDGFNFEASIKDQLQALQMLIKLRRLDTKGLRDDLDKDESGTEVETFADIMLRAQEIEDALSSGEMKSDPITKVKPRRRQGARPHAKLED